MGHAEGTLRELGALALKAAPLTWGFATVGHACAAGLKTARGCKLLMGSNPMPSAENRL